MFEYSYRAPRLTSKTDQTHRAVDVAAAESLARCLQENAMQTATVNAQLRRVVPGVEAARVVPHLLTKPRCKHHTASADAHAIEIAQKFESLEHLHRVRQEVDTNTQLTKFERRLIDVDLDASVVECSAAVNPPIPPPAMSTFIRWSVYAQSLEESTLRSTL